MDDTSKKISSVKLPEELRRQLRMEVNERFAKGLPEPTFGDLLLEAWVVYKADAGKLIGLRSGTQIGNNPLPQNDNIVTPPSGGSTITSPGSSKESGINSTPKALESVVLLGEIREPDVPWVRKLLQILHGNQEVARGIQINIDQFTIARSASEGHTISRTTEAIQLGGTAVGGDKGDSPHPAVGDGDKEPGPQPPPRAGRAQALEKEFQEVQKLAADRKRRDDKKPRRKRNVG